MTTKNIPSIASPVYKMLGVVLVFMVCFIYAFPFWIYVADEVSYINRAFQLFNPDYQQWWAGMDDTTGIPADYPLGTSYFLTPFISIFSIKGIYLANLMYLSFSSLFIYQGIRLLNSSRVGLTAYVFCCLPILFYSRTAMSELPSMMIVGAAFYCYFAGYRRSNYLFLFTALAALSVWFRESNAILFVIPVIHLFVRQSSKIPVLIGGLLLGFIPRVFSAWTTYGDPFFLKDPGYGFSLNYFTDNISIYAVTLIFLFPGLLYFISHFKTSRQQILNSSIIIFIVFHMLYGYDGMDASGIKGILLESRFIIPALPMVLFSFSMVQKNWITRLAAITPWLAMLAIVGFHTLMVFAERPLKKFNAVVTSHMNDDATFYIDENSPELLEIVTPHTVKSKMNVAALSTLPKANSTNDKKNRFIIHQIREDNQNREHKQVVFDASLEQILIDRDYTLIYFDKSGYQLLQLYRLND